MKDINENLNDFQATSHSSHANEEPSKSQSSTAKGDYIDFEEIK